MNKQTKIISALLGAALAAASGVAVAESQYGYAPYSAAPSAAVTAQASVKLTVQVPKLILLRIGTAGNTIDEAVWGLVPSIPAGNINPTAGNNTSVAWDGTAPTFAPNPTGNALTVWAWTNAGPAALGCAAPTWSPSSGPANGDITVLPGAGAPAHPSGGLLCSATSSFAANSVQTGIWTYGLLGTNAASWPAGSYSATVTYTATSI